MKPPRKTISVPLRRVAEYLDASHSIFRPDLTGQRFGRRVVLANTRDAYGKPACLCLCDCGVQSVVRRSRLLQGDAKSCRKCRPVTHGDRRHGSTAPEFHAWDGMLQRCGNPENAAYHQYGGRGIRICARWLSGYENFLADMGRRPSPQHSLDRFPDPDGNYAPDNCRWATSVEQGNNRCSNRLIEWQGRTQTVAQWARELEVPYGTLRWRLDRGWHLERALAPRLGLIEHPIEFPAPRPRSRPAQKGQSL